MALALLKEYQLWLSNTNWRFKYSNHFHSVTSFPASHLFTTKSKFLPKKKLTYFIPSLFNLHHKLFVTWINWEQIWGVQCWLTPPAEGAASARYHSGLAQRVRFHTDSSVTAFWDFFFLNSKHGFCHNTELLLTNINTSKKIKSYQAKIYIYFPPTTFSAPTTLPSLRLKAQKTEGAHLV